jgi:hypothetical protein
MTFVPLGIFVDDLDRYPFLDLHGRRAPYRDYVSLTAVSSSASLSYPIKKPLVIVSKLNPQCRVLTEMCPAPPLWSPHPTDLPAPPRRPRHPRAPARSLGRHPGGRPAASRALPARQRGPS